jgi:hypothetical protein
MEEAYRRAFQIKLEGKHKDLAYPLTNWLTANLAAAKRLPTKDIDEVLDNALQLLREKRESDPDYFGYVMVPDCEVIRCLHHGNLEEHAEEIINGYNEAWKRGGSERQIDSVVKQFSFQIRALESRPSPRGKAAERARKELESSVRALDLIRTQVEEFAGQNV